MSKIKILSEAVCNRIAAGEVVERPASVVKELVENSLDAGATKITVMVEKGGRNLISVTDNGEGMDPDDAMLCLESHATSKISDVSDIFAINSFGFRGEAMPSIASISKMSLRTRRRDSPEGFEVNIHGAKLISSSPAGCAPGTTIIVRDLFFNVPARQKFMRTVATEERHIVENMTNIALANPHVSFELFLDGRSIISSPAAETLIPRIRELFGKEFADAMLPVSKSEHAITVTGFISKRSFTKPSRQDQRIFINSRPIESPAVYRGIKEGYGPTLEKGRYQPAFLFISMNPAAVDVNVHPAKKEVRFRNEFEVISAVRSAVTSALRTADPVIPYTPGQINKNVTNAAFFPDYPIPTRAPQTPSPDIPGMPSQTLSGILQSALIEYQAVTKLHGKTEIMPATELFNPDSENTEEETTNFKLSSETRQPGAFPGTEGLRLIGIFENSYIIASILGGLILIDQHAAHERILFERILKNRDSSLSQKLLIPITLELSRADIAFVAKNTEVFEQLGFEIEPFGQNTIKLNGIPAALPQDNAGGIFSDIVSRMLESGSGGRAETEQIARVACKAAVKAHDRLSMDEAQSLIKDLGKCELPFSCPHGRPTILNISLTEIERRFGRK